MTLNTLAATDLRDRIASREISPVALVLDCISAIEALNPAINAVVTPCFETALEQAKDAEARVARSDAIGPLHGLPVLIKDLSDTAGLRTTYGSRCYEGHVPEKDSLVVAKLRAAGAIPLGKTNTPEFGAGANTNNLVFGATGNPFNPSLTAGGSSGGSAAALACDMAPIATGSDLGGSLRIPASFCSIVGMRPSPGVVPSHSHVCGFSPLWTDGPMARNVDDLALMLSAISGFYSGDPLSTPSSAVGLEGQLASADLGELRVGFSTDLGVADVDDDIAALFASRKNSIANRFKSCADVSVDLSAAPDVFKVLRAQNLFASYGKLAADRPGEIGANLRLNIEQSKSLTFADTARADAAHTQLYRAFQTTFESVDVLICPATAVSPFPLSDNHPTEINGRALEGYYSWYAVTWALSLVGCPVVTIPCGLDHNGMPFGIQLVGRRHGDFALLQIARSLESLLNADGIGRAKP